MATWLNLYAARKLSEVVARVNISDTVENREGVVCNDLHT